MSPQDGRAAAIVSPRDGRALGAVAGRGCGRVVPRGDCPNLPDDDCSGLTQGTAPEICGSLEGGDSSAEIRGTPSAVWRPPKRARPKYAPNGNLVCLLTGACLNVHFRGKWSSCTRCFSGSALWYVQFRRKRDSCKRRFSGPALWRESRVTGMGRGGSSPGAACDCEPRRSRIPPPADDWAPALASGPQQFGSK